MKKYEKNKIQVWSSCSNRSNGADQKKNVSCRLLQPLQWSRYNFFQLAGAKSAALLQKLHTLLHYNIYLYINITYIGGSIGRGLARLEHSAMETEQ